MHTIVKRASSLLLLLQSVVRLVTRKKTVQSEDRVLFIMNGGLGDGLLNFQAINSLMECFHRKNKQISIICTSAEWKAYTMLLDTSEIDYNECTFLSAKEIYKTTEQLVAQKFEDVIVIARWNSPCILYLITHLTAACIHAVFWDTGDRRLSGRIKFLLAKHAVDDSISLDDNSTQAFAVRRMVTSLGGTSYKIKIAPICQRSRYNSFLREYITVAVDSSLSKRQWDPEKFIILINQLLVKYDYDVILTGNSVPRVSENRYRNAFSKNKRVNILVNQCNFESWIELIRGSKFHIGVDSGSIHVAASVGTRAFCLTGKWEGITYFPYQIEEETEGTIEPICIFRQDVDRKSLLCYACKRHGGYGWGNRACYRRCRRGEPCLCLEDIQVEDVIETIKKYFPIKEKK